MLKEQDDLLVFAEETEARDALEGKELKWKVMIVDDEKDVHEITTCALMDFKFDNRRLELISAYSGTEAIRLVEDNPDVAVILMDVVIEKGNSGLKLIRHIREVLQNFYVRIVLRAGEIGLALEKELIRLYDINDYKDKDDLTVQKLHTTIFSSLRAYRDIMIIEANRRGLERVIEISSSLFELQSMDRFVSRVLSKLVYVISPDKDLSPSKVSAFLINDKYDPSIILSGIGVYSKKVARVANETLNQEVHDLLETAKMEMRHIFLNNRCVLYIEGSNQITTLIYLERDQAFHELEVRLMELFCSNISIAFNNIYLYEKKNRHQDGFKRYYNYFEELVEKGTTQLAKARSGNHFFSLSPGLGFKGMLHPLRGSAI